MRCSTRKGSQGIELLAPISDVIVIVDILSFSTSVDIATSNGALIFPYRWKDESAIDFANSVDAGLASIERKCVNGFSLSPSSLLSIKPLTKLVLPHQMVLH